MGGQNYKIALLKGSANYDHWLEDIRGILVRDHCWLVTIGKEIAPKIPRALPEVKPASVRDNRKSIKAVVNTELAKDAHEAKMEKYGEKLLDCDNNYSRVCATIWLNFEDGVGVHIKGVEIPHPVEYDDDDDDDDDFN